MRCPSCQADNREARRFCRECGAALPRGCSACGFENEVGEAYCGGCGVLLAPRPSVEPARQGERRPVTVLFADLSGYTRLSSSLDPEDVHALLQKFFSKTDGAIAELGGTIDKHIGDNVMALFGAPTAHDNDPERAVRSALEIHARAEALSKEVGFPVTVHIGIASGEVVASGLGSRHHQAYTVVGDAANLASRLQDKAAACETVVSEAVYRATRHLACYEAAGEVSVKGLDAPVRIFKLIGLGPAASAAPSRLIGRRAELAELRALLEDVGSRGRGAVALVRGEAGIGKTRLCEELSKLGSELGYVCHRVQVLDFGVGAARDPARALGLALTRSAPDALSELEPRLAVLARELMGLAQDPEQAKLYEQMDPETRSAGRKRVLGALLERAAESAPVLVLVEDLHWADPVTLETLVGLGRAATELPAVVVFTSRMEDAPLEQPTLTLDLGPLGEDDARELARATFERDAGLRERCVERAAGNPLFLLQLLENIREGADEKLPSTLQSLVLARVDRLPDAHRAALMVASVIGQRFAAATLRALLADPDYDPETLIAHELLRADGGDLRFSHSLIREGIYSSLTRARRRALHVAAAEHFAGRDARVHAEHLERADDERAPRAYLEAARREAAAFHFERAFDLLEKASSLARERADRRAIASLRGELALDVGEAREAERAFRAALEASDDDLDRCRASIGLAAAHRRLSEHEQGMAELAVAEPIAVQLDLPLERSQIHYYRGCLLFAKSKREESRAEHLAALEQAERAGSPLLRARAFSGLADAEYALGHVAAAARRFEECVAVCEQHGFERIALPNRLMLCFSGIFEGRLREMSERGREVLSDALRLGDRHSEMFAEHMISLVHVLRGDPGTALSPARRALEMARELHARRFEAEFLGVLAEVHTASGELDEARSLITPALEIARQTGLGFVGPWLLGLAAFLATDSGERDACSTEAEALLDGDVLSYNHFFYRRWSIETALRERDAGALERHAHGLVEVDSTLDLYRVFAERGLAWAAFLRGERSPELRARVRELAEALDRFGARLSLPEL